MFFTFTFGIGASSTGAAADGAAEALGAAAGASAMADAEGAGGATAAAEGIAAEFVAGATAFCPEEAVDAAAPAFDAAAEPSGADAPEHALTHDAAATTAHTRRNIALVFISIFILVFPDST